MNSAERYTFHDLSPLTDYHITIWAVNKAGSGPVSTVNVTTLRLGTKDNTPDVTTIALAVVTSFLLILFTALMLLLALKW